MLSAMMEGVGKSTENSRYLVCDVRGSQRHQREEMELKS